MPAQWRAAFRAFGAVHASSDVTAPPSTLSDVLAQPLFHNRRLAGPGGAPLVDKWSGCLDGPWQPWATGGIERIADLVEREGPGYALKTLATLQCDANARMDMRGVPGRKVGSVVAVRPDRSGDGPDAATVLGYGLPLWLAVVLTPVRRQWVGDDDLACA